MTRSLALLVVLMLGTASASNDTTTTTTTEATTGNATTVTTTVTTTEATAGNTTIVTTTGFIEVETVMTAAPAGATNISLADVDGINPGDDLLLGQGTLVTVATVTPTRRLGEGGNARRLATAGTVGLTAPLATAQPAGTTVKKVPPGYTTTTTTAIVATTTTTVLITDPTTALLKDTEAGATELPVADVDGFLEKMEVVICAGCPSMEFSTLKKVETTRLRLLDVEDDDVDDDDVEEKAVRRLARRLATPGKLILTTPTMNKHPKGAVITKYNSNFTTATTTTTLGPCDPKPTTTPTRGPCDPIVKKYDVETELPREVSGDAMSMMGVGFAAGAVLVLGVFAVRHVRSRSLYTQVEAEDPEQGMAQSSLQDDQVRELLLSEEA